MAAAFSTAATGQNLTGVGAEYLIGDGLPGDQVYPALSFNATGGYLIWQDSAVDGYRGGSGVAAFRLDGGLNASGAPFRVSEKPRGHQQHPQVSVLSNGGAIFVWESGQRGSNNVFARFVRPDASFLTGDIQVSPTTRTLRTNYLMNYLGYKNNRLVQRKPRVIDSTKSVRERSHGISVGALPDGGAVIVYSSTRRLFTNVNQVVQKVTRVRNRSYTNDVPQRVTGSQDFMKDVFFQRFDAAGNKVGGEVIVNQWTRYNQRDAAVAMLPDGSFVITYVSEKAVLNGSSFGNVRAGVSTMAAQVDINARLFNSQGEPAGNEFTVNTELLTCASPVVSALPDGRFTIVWEQRDLNRTNGWDLYARVYAADTSPAGAVMPLNTFTYGDQFSARIATAGNRQLVVWLSRGQDLDSQQTATRVLPDGSVVTVPTGRIGTWQSVYARLVSDGVPVGTEFRVNATLGRQLQPQVAGDGEGRFLATWTSFIGDTGFDLVGQRYDISGTGADLSAALGVINRELWGDPRQQVPFPPQPPLPGLAERRALSAPATQPDLSGEITLPVLTFSGSPDNLTVNWTTQDRAIYQVQSSTDLKTWNDVGPLRTGSGGSDSLAIAPGGLAGYFRVVRVQ